MTFMVWKHPDIAGIEDGSQQQITGLSLADVFQDAPYHAGCASVGGRSAGKKEFNALVANTNGDDEKKKRENDNAPVHPAVAMCDRIRCISAPVLVLLAS
jgi:type VI secretion system protein ImpL